MRTKGYELVIRLIDEKDFNAKNELQSVLFATEKQAEDFYSKFDFDCEMRVEVYINYHNLDEDLHYEVERLR